MFLVREIKQNLGCEFSEVFFASPFRCSELLSADMGDISLAESACKLGLGKTEKVAKFYRDASLLKGCLK